MTFLEKQQIISIRNKIPDQWIDLTNTNQLSINIVPNRKVKLVGSDMNIFFLARIVISIKPSSESRDIPIGFERWCVDLQLDLGQTSHHTLITKYCQKSFQQKRPRNDLEMSIRGTLK